MAIEKTIELNVDSKGAQADFGKLAGAIQELNKTFSKFSEDTTDGLEDVSESSKKTEKGVGKVGQTLKNLGNGIGVIFLLNKAFEIFKDLAQENQVVMDAFNTVFEVLSIAFNDFFSFITSNSGGIIDTFKAIFKDPSETIKSLGKNIYEGVVVRFEQLIEVLGLAGKAIGQLVKGEFSAAFDTIKEAGRETVDVFTGVDDSFDTVAETVSNYAKETLKAAKNNVELANNAKLAAAQQTLLVEKYDRQAEQLRQVRDDERNSITERKKANEELLAVLEQQENAMLLTADAQLASAQADLAKNDSIENQVSVTEALANRLGVLAQVEGFRSEQQANDLALSRESIELTNSKNEAESNLSIERQRFNAEQIEDEVLKLEALKQIDLLYGEKEAERLQAIVDNSNAETQAKIDAQIALDEFTEQSRQINLANKKAVDDAEKEVDTSKKEAFIGNAEAVSGALNGLSALAGENAEAQKGIGIAQAVIDTYVGANKAIAQGGIAGTVAAVGVIASGLANVMTIAKTKIPKPQGASGGGSASASTSSISAPPTPPSFNVVGATETSVLSNAVAGQTNEPVKAYVVSNDVTTAQSLDNNIIEGATI